MANYEISDWLNNAQNSNSIAFVRKIETDFKNLKHEEKERVDEEIRFREKHFCFVEDPFLDPSSNKLWTSEEWINTYKSNRPSRVFIVDVGGHFVVAKPIKLIAEGDNESKQILLVINSYTPNSVPNYVLSALYSLYFDEDFTPSLLGNQNKY